MTYKSPEDSHVVLERAEYQELMRLAESARANAAYQAQQVPPQATPVLPFSSPSSQDTPCVVPTFFDGDQKSLCRFLSQVKLYFLARPMQFQNDASRIYFTCSLSSVELRLIGCNP